MERDSLVDPNFGSIVRLVVDVGSDVTLTVNVSFGPIGVR